MSLCHAIVCFDRREARVFQVTSQGANTRHLCSRRQTCSKTVAGANDDAATATFFETILAAIGSADQWVIAGASGDEFLAWLGRTWPALVHRVVLVRTCDDPTDGELLTLAMQPVSAQHHVAA